MKIKCACGCNKTFYKFDNRGRIRKYISGHNMYLKKKIGNILNCPICKKSFYRKPYYIIQTKRPTCSYKCAYKYQSQWQRGENHPNWKGFFKHGKGYIGKLAHGNPMSDSQGRILEHRLIVSKIIGRPLKNNEHVHHINHNKLDNRPENLQVMSPLEHAKLHAKEKHLKASKHY